MDSLRERRESRKGLNMAWLQGPADCPDTFKVKQTAQIPSRSSRLPRYLQGHAVDLPRNLQGPADCQVDKAEIVDHFTPSVNR